MPKLNLNQFLDDDFEEYGDDLEGARGSGLRARRQPRRSVHAVLDEMAQHGSLDPLAAQAIFQPAFSSSHHEREWILNSLGPFYDNHVITDVLRQVRGGKEATVYCCAAHPDTGLELIAAKVYRPRMFRNLRNDSRYLQGRPILDKEGKVDRTSRVERAVRKRTEFGKAVLHATWMEHEFQTLQALHAAGVDVPRPLTSGHDAILMEYVGAVGTPAPTLNHVRLSPEEAPLLFDRLLGNVERMLACSIIHGDFSAFNVLYWEGQVRIIDFPQAVAPWGNSEAFDIFQRDVERLCQYFDRYGIASDPPGLANDLWARHVRAPHHFLTVAMPVGR
jgi:RIO kinase 1